MELVLIIATRMEFAVQEDISVMRQVMEAGMGATTGAEYHVIESSPSRDPMYAW